MVCPRIAKQVQEVTVVEPSAAMCDLLRKHMKEEGVNNIRIIPSLWEEVPEEELEEYDLIVASYSLNMPDFLEAALKMDRHSKGEVWLYWFAGETSWEQDKRILSARLGDPTPVSCHRKIDTFYNILYKAGIYCDIIHGVDYTQKKDFQWISLIRLPEFVTKEVFDWAIREAMEKKQQDFSPVEFFPWEEGLCVQCMHIGPYDDEPATVSAMWEYAKAKGYEEDFGEDRFHHEIYLSDVRRCKPERLKTVIRHPIKRTEL